MRFHVIYFNFYIGIKYNFFKTGNTIKTKILKISNRLNFLKWENPKQTSNNISNTLD